MDLSMDFENLKALAHLLTSRRAREILKYLYYMGRQPTKRLLRAALGRVSKNDHHLLVSLAALGLIRRYPGTLNGTNIPVIWNEITPLGRKVLELVEGRE